MKEEVVSTGMRPSKGQSIITLPVTFDYSGGRKDKQSTAKIWSVILGVVAVILSVGMLFNKEHSFLINLPISIAMFYIITFIIRFFLLKEGPLRRETIELEDSDFERSTKDFWGIYNIENRYPYYCRFRNGKTGIFIRFNKDVILGKYSELEYEHYEAIADAYNICGSSNIQMCHIDYMDNIGSDERLEESFVSLGNVRNPDVKDVLTDIFAFQKEQMAERVTTFDAYLFLWSGSDINAWGTLQKILSCFLQANYRSYQILDENSLRELTKTVMNLKEFSVIHAMLNAFNTKEDTISSIVPIKLIHGDGSVEILGKTVEEKRQERELAERREELRKQELKNRKSRKNIEPVNEEEEIDLFADDEDEEIDLFDEDEEIDLFS